MKNLIAFFIIFISMLACISVDAQNTPDSTIKEFFTKYRLKRNNALDYVFSTNSYISQDKISKVKESLANLSKQIGNYDDYELITKKSAGKDFVLYSYLVKYDRQPLRFTFIFYRAKDVWNLYNFKFDSNVDDELEKAAVIQMLLENLGESK